MRLSRAYGKSITVQNRNITISEAGASTWIEAVVLVGKYSPEWIRGFDKGRMPKYPLRDFLLYLTKIKAPEFVSILALFSGLSREYIALHGTPPVLIKMIDAIDCANRKALRATVKQWRAHAKR